MEYPCGVVKHIAKFKCDALCMWSPGIPSSTGSRIRRNKSMPMPYANSITGLVFQDQDCLISCGAGDGFVSFQTCTKRLWALCFSCRNV